MTALHRKNNIVQEQFLAMLELKKYGSDPGRPKKTISIDEIAIQVSQRNTPITEICEMLNISQRTFFRIKKDNMLA